MTESGFGLEMARPVFTVAEISTDMRPDRINGDGGKAASETSIPFCRRPTIATPEGTAFPATRCILPCPTCTDAALPEVTRETPERSESSNSVEPSDWVETGATAFRT